jgi:hypothetical protein
MARKNETLSQAEQLVRDILTKNFNQKVKAGELREIAQKVVESVPAPAKEAA